MADSPTVAVLGLGSMGHAFAANLLKKGFVTRVWNRTRAKAEDLERDGAVVGDTPRAAAEGADVVITMAPNGAITESILLDEHDALGGFKQGAVLAQMGTIGVDATQKLLEAVQARRPDVVYVDAPVSGTKVPAEQGQVLVLAGGDRARATAVEPVFGAIAKDTRWLGGVGAGSRMKLVVNAWLAAMTQGLAESARLAEALGFSTEDLWSSLDGGPLAAPYARLKLQAIGQRKFDAQFQLVLGLKDIRLALDAAGTQPLPSLRCIAGIWDKAVENGGGKEDVSVVYRYLEAH